MVSIISAVLALVFLFLSGIHINWVLGGTWGLNKALPTTLEDKRVLNPKKIDTLIVALGLLGFAVFYLIIGEFLKLHLPNWINKYGIWFIPSIFTLRAMGDFYYVGFFKKIKTTEFGKADTKLFSPLCLILGVLGFIIALTTNNMI